MAINARPFVADTIKDLNAIQRSHLPFVLAKTLTETAKGAAQRVRMRTRQKFNLHGEFITRGIRIKPAQKADLTRFGFIESDVHTAPIISGFMPLHETGGTKIPHVGNPGHDKGKSLALPGKDLSNYSTKTKTGRTRQRWRPGKLLEEYSRNRSRNRTRQPNTGRGARRKPFIIESGTGTALIVRRTGRGKRPLQRLYMFAPRAKIKDQWNFEPTVRRFVVFSLDKKFQRNMKAAIR